MSAMQSDSKGLEENDHHKRDMGREREIFIATCVSSTLSHQKVQCHQEEGKKNLKVVLLEEV